MGELDREACIEILTDLIREEGDAVYIQGWDSGGLGAGADFVYKFRGWYWWDDEFCMSGPFESLVEAFPESSIVISDATIRIRSSEWDTEAIVENLKPHGLTAELVININGEDFDVLPEGMILPRD